MENLKSKLGLRIKYLRKSQNITQEKLAELINMDITSLSKIETGRNYPQPDTLEKISNALGVEVFNLFTFAENLSAKDYLDGINKNLQILKDNEEKMKLLYKITLDLI